jgi:quercetin dioxygenase-like cupin family protein
MKRSIISALLCVIGVCLFISPSGLAPVNAQDTTEQIISQLDEILNQNPLPAGQKGQMIKIAEDNTMTLSVARLTEGAGLKPHIHKAHNEIIYVIKGTMQLFVNDNWVNARPGSIHFNPMGKVHGTRQTGAEPAVAISIFTPAMKESDRHFVE